MIVAVLLSHAADLATFLVGMRYLSPSAELGFTGTVWPALGDLGAIAWKCAGLAVVLVFASWAGRYQRALLGLALATGLIGAIGNTVAIEQAIAYTHRGASVDAVVPPAAAPGAPTLGPVLSDALMAGLITHHGTTGTSSWYCLAGRSACTRGHPSGLFAAAGPALRVGDWRGSSVNVCTATRCVTVTLIDWCACPRRVLDLYSDAFRQLDPLSRGLVRVTVTP